MQTLSRKSQELMVFMINNDIKKTDQNIIKTRYFYDVMRFLIKNGLASSKRIKMCSSKIYHVNYYTLTFDGWIMAKRIGSLI